MKSKYAELFTAKLNDMDLVLFEKHQDWGKWALASYSDRHFMVSDDFEYFLWLPQHIDAVLRGLNGEIVESTNKNREDWSESSVELWATHAWYMCDNYVSRTKPKKEKRWIAVNPRLNVVGVNLYETLDEAMVYVGSNFSYPDEVQFIEIEVDV